MQQDRQLFDIIEREKERQLKGIELIASENFVSEQVMQAMGRKIGFIPAAARLADPEREMPLQIYLAESPCSLDQLTDNVNDQLKKSGRCMVVVSEGFDVGDV